MDALLRRRTMIAAGGSTPPTPPAPVPSQVEYLEITDAYFDTGINAKNTQNFELDIELLSDGGSACLFGARNNNLSQSQDPQYYSLSVYANGSGYLALNDYYYDSSWLTGKSSILNSRCLVKVLGRELFVDNTEYVASGKTGAYSYNVTIGLLRMHGLSDSWQTEAKRAISAKVYRFKIYDNSTLVCDLVPVKDGNDVGCFYDIITQGYIYTVAGTVTPGPDINNI